MPSFPFLSLPLALLCMPSFPCPLIPTHTMPVPLCLLPAPCPYPPPHLPPDLPSPNFPALPACCLPTFLLDVDLPATARRLILPITCLPSGLIGRDCLPTCPWFLPACLPVWMGGFFCTSFLPSVCLTWDWWTPHAYPLTYILLLPPIPACGLCPTCLLLPWGCVFPILPPHFNSPCLVSPPCAPMVY